jgi:hypothetical protein
LASDAAAAGRSWGRAVIAVSSLWKFYRMVRNNSVVPPCMMILLESGKDLSTPADAGRRPQGWTGGTAYPFGTNRG